MLCLFVSYTLEDYLEEGELYAQITCTIFLSSTCTFKNKYNGETDCKSTYQNVSKYENPIYNRNWKRTKNLDWTLFVEELSRCF